MNTKNTVSPLFKIVGWLIGLIAFAIGFWHTHLGLKSFEILSSSYGSLIASFLILLVMLLSFSSALKGNRTALFFYLVCAVFYFTFNMSSLYPNRLGRKLLKEEAIALNDSLQNFVSKANRELGKEEVNKNFNKLENIRDLLYQEVKKQEGFGDRAKSYLEEYNSIVGTPKILPSLKLGRTQEERNDIADDYKILLDKRIETYVKDNLGVGKVDIIQRVNELKSIYEPELIEIIEDNSKLHLDSIKTHPQIKTLQKLVTKMDNVCTDANKIAKQSNVPNVCSNYGDVQSQNIGTFEHTIWSVFHRLNKIDTWGIIFFCLFIDLIVPLAVYFLIRKRDDDDESDFFKLLFSKNKNFNKN